jgi:tripartite-type tricarboxylate transporter receptor subunit TctC
VNAALLALIALATAAPCAAQDWPVRPVRIVVPSPPGDGSDLTARILAERLAQALGQPFVVDNRPGAGGVVGTESAARAAPDGHTLIMGNAGSHGINAAIYRRLPYDVERDFAPISLVFRSANVFLVNPQLPVRTVAELVAYARARNGELSYGSGGQGSSAHMTTELLRARTGMQATHVPYRGASPALADLIGGRTQFMAVNLPPAVPFIRSGQLRAIAVTTRERSALLPDVPTVVESGVPEFETVAWFGLLAPAGTPAAILDRLQAEVARACADQDVRARIAAIGGEAVCGSRQALAEQIAGDVAKWRGLVASAGLEAAD